MHDPKPFAVAVPTGIIIANERVCSDGRQRVADAINEAVAERERQAAARALREAANDPALQVAHWLVVDALDVRQMLRSRADRAEKGVT